MRIMSRCELNFNRRRYMRFSASVTAFSSFVIASPSAALIASIVLLSPTRAPFSMDGLIVAPSIAFRARKAALAYESLNLGDWVFTADFLSLDCCAKHTVARKQKRSAI